METTRNEEKEQTVLDHNYINCTPPYSSFVLTEKKQQHITKTCPINTRKCFSEEKIENFFGKMFCFSIFLLKTNTLWVHVRSTLSINKGTDQLCSNCTADQHLCFRYTDSTIPLLSRFKICSLLPSCVIVQPDLFRTWSEPRLLFFSCTGSLVNKMVL